MLSLRNSIVELEEYLRQVYPLYLKILYPGLNESVITNLTSKRGFVNEQIIELYKWRNGIFHDSSSYVGKNDICSWGKFMPLEEAVEHFEEYTNSNAWLPKYFPLFTTHAGDYLLFNTDSSDDGYQKIFIYSPSLWITVPVVIFESLEKCFITIFECYQNGVYKMVAENLEIDFDLEKIIAEKNNPGIEYWKS